MNSHVTKVVAEARFHECPRRRVQGPATALPQALDAALDCRSKGRGLRGCPLSLQQPLFVLFLLRQRLTLQRDFFLFVLLFGNGLTLDEGRDLGGERLRLQRLILFFLLRHSLPLHSWVGHAHDLVGNAVGLLLVAVAGAIDSQLRLDNGPPISE
jgi:hypothetical protein